MHLVSCEKYTEISIFWRNDSNIVKRSVLRANIQDVRLWIVSRKRIVKYVK